MCWFLFDRGYCMFIKNTKSMIFSKTVFGHESVLLTPGRGMRIELGRARWDVWGKMQKGEKAMMSSK